MGIDDSATLDEPWARSGPARIARELLICGVFGWIIDSYSRRETVGREHLERLEGPVIFVANHCSHVDTPALLRSLPARWRRRTAVAAAADYFYTKRLLAGAVSLAFCTVPINRTGVGAGAASHIEHLIEAKWNLVVFAEGTRSRDGRVGLMRSGAAVLAAQHRVPIVPVHISGTHGAMPPGRAWMVRPEDAGRWARHAICVSFGAPIRSDPHEDRREVMERVRLFMESCGAETTPDPKLEAWRTAAAAKATNTASASSGQHL